MFKKESFTRWMEQEGYAVNTRNTHNYQLNRADKFINGIDEFIEKSGIDGALKWVAATKDGPFENYPNQLRSAIRRYIEFTVGEKTNPSDDPDETLDEIIEEAVAPAALFTLEREMQLAVRKQLHVLEHGLKAIDEGAEVQVATGRIDILASDARGDLVVIELKVGKCPPGALEQALGYAEALSEERRLPVRAFLVAGEFPDRIRAAAKRTKDIELRTYQLAMSFDPVA